MPYPPSAVERAMKVQEIILRALSGQLTWLQAAEILGRSPRSIRRLRWRFELEEPDVRHMLETVKLTQRTRK